MKKIYLLAITLITFVGIASAQNKVMHVNLTDGSNVDFSTTEVESVTFSDQEVETPQEEWTQVGVGDYSFNVASFFDDANGVALFRHNEDPTQYKIEDWQEDLPFYFQCYDDNSAYVLPDQDTGTPYTYQGYTDAIRIAEATDYTSWTSSKSDATSYYDPDTDTYNFAVAYYMYIDENHEHYAHWNITGYNTQLYDTFVVTSRTNAPKKKAERPQIDIEPTVADNK